MKHILAADIGGTNCRLAHFTLENSELCLQNLSWRFSTQIKNTTELLSPQALAELGLSLTNIDAFICAIAAPVTNPDLASTSNADLTIDLKQARTMGIKQAYLINDFTAQAYACVTPAISLKQVLGPESNFPDWKKKGIIGAGTGLGASSLLKLENGHCQALESELGHSAFPFSGQDENEFHNFICQNLHQSYACGDNVLSGLGLSLLHEFLSGKKAAPADIELIPNQPTFEWYARLYGRMCRSWVLISLCLDGLYIVGGIAAKHPELLSSNSFSESFYDSHKYKNLIKTVPVYLNDNENSGLWGAAFFGQQMLSL